MGFKENVIMGHIIPGGTGFKLHMEVKKFIGREYEKELEFNFSDEVIAPLA
jgi:DNA-directed RNA polymerase subunit beta'